MAAITGSLVESYRALLEEKRNPLIGREACPTP